MYWNHLLKMCCYLIIALIPKVHNVLYAVAVVVFCHCLGCLNFVNNRCLQVCLVLTLYLIKNIQPSPVLIRDLFTKITVFRTFMCCLYIWWWFHKPLNILAEMFYRNQWLCWLFSSYCVKMIGLVNRAAIGVPKFWRVIVVSHWCQGVMQGKVDEMHWYFHTKHRFNPRYRGQVSQVFSVELAEDSIGMETV